MAKLEHSSFFHKDGYHFYGSKLSSSRSSDSLQAYIYIYSKEVNLIWLSVRHKYEISPTLES